VWEAIRRKACSGAGSKEHGCIRASCMLCLTQQWVLPGLHAASRGDDSDDLEVITPASCLLPDELVDEVHLRKMRQVY
jgi:hypothetical protein